MQRGYLNTLLIGALAVILVGSSCIWGKAEKTVSMAVEFNNHDACVYIAHAKGWLEEEGLELLPIFQIYESGAAVAAALARGDIQVGYMGLTAAIMTYARGVPIKVVAGIHQYGYGLVARPELKRIEDLQSKTIGCLREGTVTDLLLNLMIDKYHLKDIRIRRMNPSQEVIALISGRLDAAFLPEQHATVAEFAGYPMLLKSQDLWPNMQGDVLAVKSELIENKPDLVRKLVKLTQRATAWINDHPAEAAEIMARELQVAGEKFFPAETTEIAAKLAITPEVIYRSMNRLDYTTGIDPEVVQDTIDYMVQLGYIKNSFPAEEILDLRYL